MKKSGLNTERKKEVGDNKLNAQVPIQTPKKEVMIEVVDDYV